MHTQMFTQYHCSALALLVGLGRQLLHSAPFSGFYSRLRREEALGSHERIPALAIRRATLFAA